MVFNCNDFVRLLFMCKSFITIEIAQVFVIKY